MSMKTLLKNVDKGFYEAATAKKMNGLQFLAERAHEEGVGPSEAELQRREQRFLDYYKVTPEQRFSRFADQVRQFAADSWALEAAYADLGMKVRGPRAVTVEKVYSQTTSQVLFPIFFETAVVQGLLATSLVPKMVVEESMVDSHTAEHTSMSETAGDRKTSKTGEGARMHTLKIRNADRAIPLYKYGGGLEVTYEVMRLKRLNVVSIFLQRLGSQIGIDETDAAIEVAIAGDGNDNSAVSDTDAMTTGVLTYPDMIAFFQSFPIGYGLRLAIINDTLMRSLLSMSEFKDATAGFNFQKTGQMIDPMGAQWERWTSTGSTSFSTDRILGLDTRLAMIQYTEAGLITETDRLIDKQWERTFVSKWTGFGKLDYTGTQCFDLN